MDTDFSQSVLLYNLRVGEAGVRRDARAGEDLHCKLLFSRRRS